MIEWLSDNAGLTGLMFFFLVFISIAFWAYRPKVKEAIESHKYIPLEEDK